MNNSNIDLSTPGAAFARASSSASLAAFKEKVQDHRAHVHASKMFFEEGIPPPAGAASDAQAAGDPSTLAVSHALTEVALRVLELEQQRSPEGKITLSKKGEPLPEAQAGALFQSAVRRWLDEHALTHRIHVEYHSQVTCRLSVYHHGHISRRRFRCVFKSVRLLNNC